MALSAKVSNSPLDPQIITPGGVPRIVHGVEAASQSYKAGAIVVDSSGSVAGAAAGAVVGANNIFGIALSDATGTTATDVPILVPDANSEIIMKSSASGTANTPSTTLFPLGADFDIYIDASGYATIDSDATTNAKLTVLGLEYNALGTAVGVRCRPVLNATNSWAFLGDPT